MSLVSGLRSGLRSALRSGLNPSDASAIVGVTRDSASGRYFPASSTEWTLLMAAAGLATGNPTSCWNCQEASGTIADAFGVADLAPTPTPPDYQSPVLGYTRTALRFTDSVANQRMFNNSTAPNPNSTSTLIGAVIEFSAVAPGGTRGVVTKTGTGTAIEINTAGSLLLVDGGSAATAVSVIGGIQLVWFQTNITASTSKLYTLSEELIGTFAAPASGAFIGAGGIVPATATGMGVLQMFEFSSTAAELTKNQLRALTQTLGWAPAW